MQRKDTTRLEKKLERLSAENRSMKEAISFIRKENGELRRSLIKKDSLINSLPSGVLVIQEGVIKEINSRALETLGYTLEDLLGGDFMDIVHPASRPFIKSVHQRRLEGKKAPTVYESDLVTKSGEKVGCEVGVEKIRYNNRLAVLARLENLEGRRNRERALIRSQKEDLIAGMASGLVRKIAPPLRVISEYLKLLQGNLHSGKGSPGEGLDPIKAAVTQLADLVRTLESLARDRYEPSEAVLLDFRKVVRDAISRVEARLKEKTTREGAGIAVKSYLRQVSPVEGHPQELGDVLTILIQNAVEAMPEGGDLYVSAEENAGQAHVYVQDGGKGIPESVVPRIMDPFFSTKGRHADGLGLSLARAILRRHRGDLEIETRKGQGTTVTVNVPIREVRRNEKARVVRRRLKNSRILIIEEEPMLRELLFQVLSKKGYRVVEAEGVPEGLDRLKAKGFEMVITGTATGNLRGMKLVRRIRRMSPHTPLAVIADQGSGEPARTVHPYSVDLVIRKPVDMARMLDQVSKILMEKAIDEHPLG
ncbi:MAG: PAS domain S-box protein [Deltaproteobacteria bacterium]|nr:PAS domain S-box protein [Deltaproteobacteria bacterium]